jgi:sulfatase modifying factor 1
MGKSSALVGLPVATSCRSLAATCGPTGTSPCCESPVVSGGSYVRLHDVAADGMYPDTGDQAMVSTFRLDKYEVTVGRFRQFVAAGMGTQTAPPLGGAGGRTLNGMASQGGWDAMWDGRLPINTGDLVARVKCDPNFQTWTDAPGGNESRPMNCVNWYVAMVFCTWDDGFLPTEAEWHYAASGGSDQRAYPWSVPAAFLGIDSNRTSYKEGADCVGDGMTGCTLSDLVPVGSKPTGDGRWGQSDLGGNLWEWTLDWWAPPFPQSPCIDCANLTPDMYRVTHGGGYGHDAGFLRASYRYNEPPGFGGHYIGFRCARAL